MNLGIIFQNIFSMDFLKMTLRLASPLLLASLGAFVAGITGIGNIAIESIMAMSALFGVLGSFWAQNAILGLIIGLVMGMVMGLIIAFFVMKLGASNTLVGVALNTFSTPLATFILYQLTGSKGSSGSLGIKTFGTVNIPIIKDIPILGDILSGQYTLTYLCWAVVIILFIVIFKTPLGMRMRACGLNADAAKTAGINVSKLRLLSLVLSGLIAGLGGVFLSLNYVKIYSSGMVSGQGWMGIAANGIANGSYLALILSSVAFAAFRALAVVFIGTKFPSELVGAVPYIAVFIGVITISIVSYYKTKRGKVAEK